MSKISLQEKNILLEEIKNRILDDFIIVLHERDGDKFDDIFSYDDVYKLITNLRYVK